MNKVTEIINSFTDSQRLEFEKELAELSTLMSKHYNGSPDKVAESIANIRLQNDLYLKVTILFHGTTDGALNAVVHDIHKYNNLQEYSIAISKPSNPADGFTKIK